MTDWGNIGAIIGALAAGIVTAFGGVWANNKRKGTSVPETPANGNGQKAETNLLKAFHDWAVAFEKRLDDRLVREFGELWKANERLDTRVGTVENLAAVVDDRTKPGGRN